MLLLTAFGFLCLVQLYFFLFVFGKYAWRGQPQPEPFHAGVSVVISARNESKNLENNLIPIANQIYPDYEIVIVDDGSTDKTAEILEKFKENHSKQDRPVRILKIPPERSKGKKFALGRGIEAAAKEIVLVTDADCAAGSARWIETMTSALGNGHELVLGYGPYRKIPGSLLNKLIRYETLLTAVQYFSYALNGYPYMGVGRNMAYRRKLFIQADGFQKHQHLRSGDDDLFVKEVATEHNTTICDAKESFMTSEPKKDLAGWIRQKRRHLTTASHYAVSQQVRLTLFYLSQIGFYGLGLALAVGGPYPLLAASFAGIRFAAYYAVLWPSAQKLNEKDLLPFAPLYEISIIFMQLYMFVFNKFYPPKHW